ncbi:hypothetical protein DL546_006385 [Coniochaeta pulveracea]|uniref:Plasma membrane fusion protein PRM1 n=1 Tax=Coniochaeta pulveracea TaxID=177199 RepID=A0A420YIS0_9PEZI|nr:hypothetical protein DL546_006385 [Coniochaeta pulveracea]
MRNIFSSLFSLLLLVAFATAQTDATSPAPTSTVAPATSAATSSAPAATTSASSPASSSPATTSRATGGSSLPSSSSPSPSTPVPDVLLRVPNLSVGRIELDVDNLQAEINLAADIASLVTINAGVQIGVQKVNITISDVEAQLELIIRLGHLVDIVNRTLASLDLNPLLINVLNDVTDLVDTVVGAVDGLLGSIVQGNTKLNFLIDNLGNIVQEVTGDAGSVVSSIVGNYATNMTFTGVQKDLGNGLVQKTYQYSPLGSLVNIVFNTLGQVVQAVVVGAGQGGGGSGSSSSVFGGCGDDDGGVRRIMWVACG